MPTSDYRAATPKAMAKAATRHARHFRRVCALSANRRYCPPKVQRARRAIGLMGLTFGPNGKTLNAATGIGEVSGLYHRAHLWDYLKAVA